MPIAPLDTYCCCRSEVSLRLHSSMTVSAHHTHRRYVGQLSVTAVCHATCRRCQQLPLIVAGNWSMQCNLLVNCFGYVEHSSTILLHWLAGDQLSPLSIRYRYCVCSMCVCVRQLSLHMILLVSLAVVQLLCATAAMCYSCYVATAACTLPCVIGVGVAAQRCRFVSPVLDRCTIFRGHQGATCDYVTRTMAILGQIRH